VLQFLARTAAEVIGAGQLLVNSEENSYKISPDSFLRLRDQNVEKRKKDTMSPEILNSGLDNIQNCLKSTKADDF
jgi:hypothetical protein